MEPRYVPPPTYVDEEPSYDDATGYCPPRYFEILVAETERTDVQPFRIAICGDGADTVLYTGEGLDNGARTDPLPVSGWNPWVATAGNTTYTVTGSGLSVRGAANFDQSFDRILVTGTGE
ncbi:MAG: hypothetical protein ACOYOQ_15245 [Microthrixaceae bacterium]